MDGWNTSLSYWCPGLFSGAFAVSFREGKYWDAPPREINIYMDPLLKKSDDPGDCYWGSTPT